MSKQTAVDWLKEELEQYGSSSHLSLDWSTFDELVEQAKVMQREQIVEAYLEGVQTIHHEDYLPVHPILKGDDKCSKNGVKKEGESCTLNDSCTYPDCMGGDHA